MLKLDSLLILNAISGLGEVRIGKLLDFFGSPEKILAAGAQELSARTFLPQRIVENIVHFPRERFLKEEYALIQKHQIKVVTAFDPDYPENLREIPDAPLVLYIKGTLKAEHQMAVGIVGSRRASFYGTTLAEKFAVELAQLGITVVSGMALGIDAAAHKGVLKVKGETIAVLGNGLSHFYPPENKDLFEKIPSFGAVVSEFPMATEPRAKHFPKRNRIISGLSLGIVVVEASQKSGALITSDFALEQGREVFAIPGKLDSPNSEGVNNLIKQGAKLVTCVEDIIEELKPRLDTYIQSAQKTRAVAETDSADFFVKELSAQEKFVYNLIARDTCHLDEIVQGAGLPTSEVMPLLLTLELKKIVKQLPGKFFVRNQ